MEINEAVAKNIKQLRTSMNMTQKEFADKVGITRSIVTNIELKKGTSMQVLEQIARTFHVSVADLVQTAPIVTKSLINSIGGEQNYESEFSELPPYLQSYSKAVIVLLSKFMDNELMESKRNSAQMYIDFVRGVEEIDLNGMTAIEVKSAAINEARKAVENYIAEDVGLLEINEEGSNCNG